MSNQPSLPSGVWFDGDQFWKLEIINGFPLRGTPLSKEEGAKWWDQREMFPMTPDDALENISKAPRA